MRNLIIGIILVAVLALGTFVFIQGQDSQNNKASESTQDSTDTSSSDTDSTIPNDSTVAAEAEVTITYTDNGFDPKAAAVKSGGKITWVNNSSSQLQIGVNPHPSHTDTKEITAGQFVLSLDPGEKEIVTIETKGTFGYHNHLVSSDTGTVKVE